MTTRESYEVLDGPTAVLGEGPVWSPRRQALYWVDIEERRVHRLDWHTRAVRSWLMPERISALAERERGGFICALESAIVLVDDEFRVTDWIARPEQGSRTNRFNDGKCDRDGRFWVGSMNETGTERSAALYRVDADLSVTTARSDIRISNGLCWSPDGTTAYFADSPGREIERMAYDRRSGGLGTPHVFARIAAPGVPDGSTVDAEGFVWNAEWDGGRLCRYDPEGRLDRIVNMPFSRPTACAFGGPDMTTLFVTSATFGLSDADRRRQPSAGRLLILGLEVRGLIERPFQG